MSRPAWPGLWGSLLILAVVARRPLDVALGNWVGIGHPERLVAFVVVTWAAGIGLFWILARLFPSRRSVLNSTLAVLLMMIYGGQLIHELGMLLGWVVLIVVLISAVALIQRIGDSVFVDSLFVAIVLGLASGPLVSGYNTWQDFGEDTVVSGQPIDLVLDRQPDIFLVVVDGYPGLRAHELDEEPINTRMISELEAKGFHIPESAWSSYLSTRLSIPSILEMGYPVVGEDGGPAATERLYEIVGGDNHLVRALSQNGYTTTMVESGWSGSKCGVPVDTCVTAPFIDEALYTVLWSTVAGPHVRNEIGYFLTHGASHTMTWLLEHAESLSSNDEPDFVFAHVLAPHAPFYFDTQCERVVTDSRAGTHFYRSGVPASVRETYFRDQRDCVDQFMLNLANQVDSGDVVVFVSDHGTDRRFQHYYEPSEWPTDYIVERMNVFVAARGGAGCTIPDRVLNPNLMRAVLSCVASEQIPSLPERMWIWSEEVESDVVAALLTGEAPFSRGSPSGNR